jgi:hypothetical protein
MVLDCNKAGNGFAKLTKYTKKKGRFIQPCHKTYNFSCTKTNFFFHTKSTTFDVLTNT